MLREPRPAPLLPAANCHYGEQHDTESECVELIHSSNRDEAIEQSHGDDGMDEGADFVSHSALRELTAPRGTLRTRKGKLTQVIGCGLAQKQRPDTSGPPDSRGRLSLRG